MTTKLKFAPLTPATWDDFEAVFRARGCSGARGCWCMFYRVSGPLPPQKGVPIADRNRREMRARVEAGEFIGLVGYRDGAPVGWISFGPREHYRKLVRSPVMKAVDDEPVWSVICFVVPSAQRGTGVAHALLDGAIAYAKQKKVRLLEAYPVDKRGELDDDELWFGTKSMFDRAGFVEVARRKPARPVVRLRLA